MNVSERRYISISVNFTGNVIERYLSVTKLFSRFSPSCAQKNRITRCGLGLLYIYTIKNADA